MAVATLTRRVLLHGAAGAAAGLAITRPGTAAAHGDRHVPVPPEPIPGGIELGARTRSSTCGRPARPT